MTRPSTSNLLLAAALAFPVLARAQVITVRPDSPQCRAFSGSMTPAQAKAALAAAVKEADANARRLNGIPSEFIGLTLAMPYGAEGPEICFGDGNIPDGVAALDRKAAYWNAVCDALVADRARNEAALERGSVEGTAASARESVRRDREVRACEAVALDAKVDVALVRKLMKSPEGRESDADMLARKAAVFRALGALKTAP